MCTAAAVHGTLLWIDFGTSRPRRHLRGESFVGQRVFTPIEANRTLPLVRGIVTDILSCGRELRSRSIDEEPSTGPVRELRDRLRDLIAELKWIGCEYKDWGFEHGLVDFPGMIDGERVFYCWRIDEPHVGHYHGELDGYRGRQPIPQGALSPQPTSVGTSECSTALPSGTGDCSPEQKKAPVRGAPDLSSTGHNGTRAI